MISVADILQSIQCYADGYQQINNLQEESLLIPKGDVKTGCIGEFYGYLYLKHKNPGADLEYGDHNQKGWDIKCKTNSATTLIQIKTVSAYSKTRVMTPIHFGWNKLYIIYLDRDLKPTGFWIINDNVIVPEGEVLKGRRCRKPDNPKTRSPSIPFGDNQVSKLRNAIDS